MEYFNLIASQLGINIWILIIILVWEAIWKLIALWKSARNKHLVWFIVIALVNSIGIIPILYIYVFSKHKKSNKNLKK